MASAVSVGITVPGKKEICLWITHSGGLYDPYFNLNRGGDEGNVFKFGTIEDAIATMVGKAEYTVKKIYLEANLGHPGSACMITIDIVERLQQVFPQTETIHLFSSGTDQETLNGSDRLLDVLVEAYPSLVSVHCGVASEWAPSSNSPFGRLSRASFRTSSVDNTNSPRDHTAAASPEPISTPAGGERRDSFLLRPHIVKAESASDRTVKPPGT